MMSIVKVRILYSGLWGQWVDGCPSYAITTDRKTEFDFTLPYLATAASFTVAPGNPSGFDPNLEDYSAFNLGKHH